MKQSKFDLNERMFIITVLGFVFCKYGVNALYCLISVEGKFMMRREGQRIFRKKGHDHRVFMPCKWVPMGNGIYEVDRIIHGLVLAQSHIKEALMSQRLHCHRWPSSACT